MEPQERRVFYAKKKVQKQFAGAYSIHLIVTAGTDVHESVSMQTVSTGMKSDGRYIHSLYDKKENLSLSKILVGEFECSSLWFCYSVYSQNFGMMVFSPGENIT